MFLGIILRYPVYMPDDIQKPQKGTHVQMWLVNWVHVLWSFVDKKLVSVYHGSNSLHVPCKI